MHRRKPESGERDEAEPAGDRDEQNEQGEDRVPDGGYRALLVATRDHRSTVRSRGS